MKEQQGNRDSLLDLLKDLVKVYDNVLFSLHNKDFSLQEEYANRATIITNKIVKQFKGYPIKNLDNETRILLKKATDLNNQIVNMLQDAKEEISTKLIELKQFKKMLRSIKEKIAGSKINLLN